MVKPCPYPCLSPAIMPCHALPCVSTSLSHIRLYTISCFPCLCLSGTLPCLNTVMQSPHLEKGNSQNGSRLFGRAITLKSESPPSRGPTGGPANEVLSATSLAISFPVSLQRREGTGANPATAGRGRANERYESGMGGDGSLRRESGRG